jgi:hypothetical protein
VEVNIQAVSPELVAVDVGAAAGAAAAGAGVASAAVPAAEEAGLSVGYPCKWSPDQQGGQGEPCQPLETERLHTSYPLKVR